MEEKKPPINPYVLTFRILLIFAIPAIVGAFVGNAIDEAAGTAPFGTFLVMAVSYIIAWIVMWRVYRQIQKEVEQSKKEEKED